MTEKTKKADIKNEKTITQEIKKKITHQKKDEQPKKFMFLSSHEKD
jgi:hypothetical protein